MVKEKKWAPGKELESLINETNKMYLKEERALIYQNQTFAKVVKGGAMLMMSPPDYTGYYKYEPENLALGDDWLVPIVFDAKECSDTSFDMGNVAQHQMNFLLKWVTVSDMSDAFLVIWFKRYFYKPAMVHTIPVGEVVRYLDKEKRKSLPLKDMDDFIHPVEDYLGLMK